MSHSELCGGRRRRSRDQVYRFDRRPGRVGNSRTGGALMSSMGPRAFVSLVVVAVLGVCASPAWGAFPGRDGDLVVATGAGLELVVPASGAARSICADVLLCGRPANPSF